MRKALLKRAAIAGVLVVALLGGLALFDALYMPPAGEPAVRTAALPPAPAPEAAKPAEPEAQTEETAAEKEEIAAEPERTSAPLVSLPPAKTERPLTPPAHARPAAVRPSEPMAVIRKPEPARELARHAPPSRPLTRVAETTRQYVVQMGVFNNVANAEELRSKLEAAGVPTQIEARVQVGPFATRQEAELAREKLRSLGMESGILVGMRK
ncbi:MAG: SPOR domain-containing protein [Candidatus Nitricoxidivorans perseverans]|uniref:SPOR domain-containing protein n=1 Tax=Candidatus Nitricoxidivorans perseverans TaxID=2975601 RepID=A0AA49FK77_9PROT|nr:MAG: SPOR domain-containing protein [Candidatus Nitricoxidivorans perseverans]